MDFTGFSMLVSIEDKVHVIHTMERNSFAVKKSFCTSESEVCLRGYFLVVC